MDNRRRIPVKDVRQIMLEGINNILNISQTNDIKLKLNETKVPTKTVVEDKIMNEWIDKRIQMVLDRIDKKQK